MSSKELTRPVGSLTLDPTQTQWSAVQRAALAQLQLQDAPDADLAVFLHYCQRTGLDPFARQIYMIARWNGQQKRNVYTIQTGIDGFRVLAESHPQYGGQLGPEWCGPDGKWTDVWLKSQPPTAARVGVVRHDRKQPTYAVAHFAEYAVYVNAGDRGRVLNSMWQTKGAHMIAKCAEALALRKAFPQKLGGMYTPEETERDQPQHHESERGDSTPDSGAAAEQEGIDWDAKLAEAAGDVQKLKDLYKLAHGLEPNNHALADRIAKAGQDAKAAAEEPLEAEVVDEESTDPPAGSEPAATEKQLTAIAAALGAHDVKEREERLAVVSLLIGTRIETMKVLKASEAGHVLDTIAAYTASGEMRDTIRAAVDAWTAGNTEDGKAVA